MKYIWQWITDFAIVFCVAAVLYLFFGNKV